jgi:hypothetical protein
LPLPSIFYADKDYSTGAPPIPGMGKITCKVADPLTAARAARAAFTLAKWVAEL